MKDNLSELNKCSDDELAVKAKTDRKALSELIAGYFYRVGYIADNFYPAEKEDLVQEGLMGLLNAVRTFDPKSGVKFSTYSSVCIKNKMRSAFRKSSSISNAKDTEYDFLDKCQVDPENIIIENERMEELYKDIFNALSDMEWQVFQLFLTGMSFNQIALKLSLTRKSVNNAMQRIRRKLKSVLR